MGCGARPAVCLAGWWAFRPGATPVASSKMLDKIAVFFPPFGKAGRLVVVSDDRMAC